MAAPLRKGSRISPRPATRFLAQTFTVCAFLLVIGLCVAEAETSRLQVCAFSFNTPHEVAAFRAALPDDQFEFVDLTPRPLIERDFGSPDYSETEWLAGLCRKGLQCDVVIIAAEFAGRFFGESGTSLGLQDMEEASCRPQCQGLFHAPREVFLMGCNTLATKDADHRTPEEYLQVLLEHGFERASAERVVALRYGPLGPSFREAMRRIFKGVPRIYGFDSVAPLGPYSSILLGRYLRAKGDYRAYLDRVGREPVPNRELFAAYHGIKLNQVEGLTPTEPAALDRAAICRLYDERRPVTERLRIIRRLLDRDNMLTFLPSIEVFFRRHRRSELGGAEVPLFEEISRHPARTQVRKIVDELDVSALKLELAYLAQELSWMTPEEFRDLAIGSARQILKEPVSSEVVDIMCEISEYADIGFTFTVNDLPQRLFESGEGIQLVSCLSPADKRVVERLVPALDSDDLSARLWATHALSRRLPLGDDLLVKVAAHVGDPSPDVRARIAWILESQKPLSDEVWNVVKARDPELAERLRPEPPPTRVLPRPRRH